MRFFLTLDLEEWYHLEYVRPHLGKISTTVCKGLGRFLGHLESLNIEMTVFVLAELALEIPDVVRDIAARGHEIACHGLDHELLTKKTPAQFRREAATAKRILEDIAGQPVLGYRASCFSMDRPQLDSLRELGYKYDASFIRFSHHQYYRVLDLGGFSQTESLVYQKDGFFEFEAPTLDLFGHRLPIAGGGYFRLLPFPVYSYLFTKYILKRQQNFLFYIHPFEVVEKDVPEISECPWKVRFRFSVGRRGNPERLGRLLALAVAEGYRFTTFRKYLAA